MPVCVFFGHRECYGLKRELLQSAVEEKIAEGFDTFYVGNQGDFDGMVRSVLRELQKKHPKIRYGVVLAYFPTEGEQEEDTMYPEGLELGPPKFAITRRNRWLIRQADCVICYITHSWGGAAQFVEQARRQGKQILNLAE